MKVFKEKGVSKKFLIKTPTSVCAVRGTEVDVNVNESGSATYTLFSGNVEITNEYGTVELNEGNQTQTQPNQPPAPPVVFTPDTTQRWDLKDELPVAPIKTEEPAGDKDKTSDKDKGTEKPQTPVVSPDQEDVVIPEPPAPPLEEASPTRP
jgi:hypothetical protein